MQIIYNSMVNVHRACIKQLIIYIEDEVYVHGKKYCLNSPTRDSASLFWCAQPPSHPTTLRHPILLQSHLKALPSLFPCSTLSLLILPKDSYLHPNPGRDLSAHTSSSPRFLSPNITSGPSPLLTPKKRQHAVELGSSSPLKELSNQKISAQGRGCCESLNKHLQSKGVKT